MAGGDFWAILYLSIVATVGAFILIVVDIYYMLRTRECRQLPSCLLCADIFVLVLSSLLIYFWAEYQNGKLLPRSYGQQLTMDAFLLSATFVIFVVRLFLRAYERENGLAAPVEVELMGSDRRHQGV